MKYLIRFEKFDIKKEQPSIEVGSDMNLFNNSEVNIKDFNARKNQLLSIYTSYREDDNPVDGKPPKDLYSKLLSGKFIKQGTNNIQFLNPLFAQYAEFCAKQRQVTNVSNNLDNKKKQIEDTQKNIQNNVGDRETNNNTIKNTNTEISDQKKELDKIAKDSKDVETSTKKNIQNNVKDLENAKKRITNLTNNK